MTEKILERISELIKEIDNSKKVSLEASIRDDLEMDSVDIMSLYFELEKSFNIEIPDSDIEEYGLDVISDIVEYVKKKSEQT